jgi:hypothetical protein
MRQHNQGSRVLGSETLQQEGIAPPGGTNSDPGNSLGQSPGPRAEVHHQPHTTIH